MAKIYIHYKCSKVLSLKAARTDLLEVTCAQRLTTMYTPTSVLPKLAFSFCDLGLLLRRDMLGNASSF